MPKTSSVTLYFLQHRIVNFCSTGFQYKYANKGNIYVYNGSQRYEDRLMPKEFDYKERFFKLSVNQQIGIFQLNIDGQFGKTDNFMTGFSGNSSFYTSILVLKNLKLHLMYMEVMHSHLVIN